LDDDAEIATARVRFTEQQVLHAADLRAEQDYRVARRRRHNRLLHGLGIVHGLEVEPSGTGLTLGAGMALDALGRELIVPVTQVFMKTDLAAASQDEPLDLWLVYAEAETPPRRIETTRIHFSRAASLRPDVGRVGDFYPVFLGTIRRRCAHRPAPQTGATTVKCDEGWDVESSERLYVPLIGERVEGASGLVRVLLGPVQGHDPRRFAVGVRPAPDKDYVDALAIDALGRAQLNGPVVITSSNATPPLLVVARRSYALTRCDLLQPARLLRRLRTKDGLVAKLLAERAGCEDGPGWRRLLVAGDEVGPDDVTFLLLRLNASIAGDPLYDPDLFAAVTLRTETWRLINSRVTRPEPRQLNRLLLEDAFPAELKRLPAIVDGPHGLVLSEGAAPPKEAKPWHVYRASIPNKDTNQTDEELRLEIEHPGKQGNPALYRLCIGTTDKDDKCQRRFVHALCVAADGTVTVPGNLYVTQQLVKANPAAGPNDPAAVGDLLNAASGGQGMTVQLTYAIVSPPKPETANNFVVTINVVLGNAGTGTISGVSVLASVTVTPDKVKEPAAPASLAVPPQIRSGLALPFRAALNVLFTGVPLRSNEYTLTQPPVQVQVAVLAQGVGPGGSLVAGQATTLATLS
jgi:hypothetical protein